MILLVSHGFPTIKRYDEACLGRLLNPRSNGSIEETARSGYEWAADNDAFNGWDIEAERRFVQLLDLMAPVSDSPTLRFVAAPDVVADAKATAERFSQWRESIVGRGLPVALVAQDGIDELGVPWDSIDALFIGGSTIFKLGPVARDLVIEAKSRGKWAHMGRVNSGRRIRYASEIGCDSIDGTKYSRWPDRFIPEGIQDMKTAKLGAQTGMYPPSLLAQSALRMKR
jgi:hypothetical protein